MDPGCSSVNRELLYQETTVLELRPESVGFPRGPCGPRALAPGRGQLGPVPVTWAFPAGSALVFIPRKVELCGRSWIKPLWKMRSPRVLSTEVVLPVDVGIKAGRAVDSDARLLRSRIVLQQCNEPILIILFESSLSFYFISSELTYLIFFRSKRFLRTL